MKTVMGIMNLQENDVFIKEMTESRPIASIPFAGRYRLIDFGLSSMVNSGISNVGIMLPDKSRSVLDHLRSGKDWDLARRHEGLFYLPVAQDCNETHKGDLKNFYRHIDFIEHSVQKYVLLVSGSVIYNMDFSQVLRFHQNTGADITMVYNVEGEEHSGNGIVLEVSENGFVKDLAQRTVVYENSKVSMGIYLMDKRIFIELIRNAYEHGGSDFFLDGILRQHDTYNIYAFAHDGYVARITSTASYYKASMDLLKPEIWQELFMNGEFIYTKIKDEAPVQYKKTAQTRNSLIANGCIIEGEVENSILFRGVKIGKGVHVKNSIIMQKCDLKENSLVENVICDKNVVITKGKWLKGASNYPLIVGKDIVI